jgi:predicted amidohydrolase YtcJ
LIAHADLIITGRVATLAGNRGFGWGAGLSIGGGRILAVGRWSDLENLAGPRTKRWSLPPDLAVVPGITDAHLHLMNVVIGEEQIDLTDQDLPTALATVTRAHGAMLEAGNRDGWLLGHGWSLHALGRWPDAALLEAAAPGRPIALYAHDHHSRWLSEAALGSAAIDTAADPPGGFVRRDAGRRATGILHETASALVDHAIPVPTTTQLESGLARVAARLLALGVTGCHDPSELGNERDIKRGPLFYRSLAERGRLPLRVHASIRAPELDRAIELGLRSGQGVVAAGDPTDPWTQMLADRYHMGWLKLFADGSLGSRSAAMLEPYTDAADNPPTGGPRGMFLSDERELADLLARAAAVGISGQVHAIGDAGVRMVLDVLAGVPQVGQLMPRVEHAQLVDAADVPRFGQLGIAASVQPVHLRSDAAPARAAWGERSEGSFPLRGLIEGGALIPFGTDAPIEPVDPWPGIAVAVARRDPFDDRELPLGRSQGIELARALRAACLDPALVAGQDDLGRLLPGFRADLLVVPAAAWRDPVDVALLAALRPLVTLLDGEVVHRLETFDA